MTHAVLKSGRSEICGPCLRAGLRVPATHKIAEECGQDAPGVIRHGLTQYVCCRCFGLMMGPLAQRQCGTTFPASPRMVPVYGILGEAFAASGIVDTKPLGDQERSPELETNLAQLLSDALLKSHICPEVGTPPWMNITPPGQLPVQRVSRAERDLQASLVNLSRKVYMPASVDRLVFLDVGGVLNSRAWQTRWAAEDHDDDINELLTQLDPEAVCRLNRLLEQTGAQVVLSSTWRMFPLTDFTRAMRKRGFVGAIRERTPSFVGMPRSCEIAGFLTGERCREDAAYVIFDGEPLPDVLQERFIQTDPEVGLTDEDVDRAIVILTKQSGEGNTDDRSS